MMQWICIVSLKKHLSSEALRGRLGIDCVSDLVRRGRLRWFGHFERKGKEMYRFNVKAMLGGVGLESPGWNV